MQKVLHISGAKGWGGNEQQLIDLVQEFKSPNIENIVLGVGGSILEKKCKMNDILFIPVKTNKLNKFVNYKYIKQITKDLKPDIIHLHTSDSLTAFVISDLLYKIKIPSVFSKKGMGRSSSFLSKFKYNYKNLSAIICVSEKVKREFSEILSEKNRKKLIVIYDGISILRMKSANHLLLHQIGLQDTKFKLINIGNHVRAKDLPTLIQMMNILVNDLGEKQVQLVQIGEFKDEITDKLQQMIDRFQLNNHVKLTGFIEDASSYLSQFDIFVMSSEREGLPLTIYEAFYKKVPVVSTKAGGIPEVISDDKNGLLVEIGDYKNMALKINQLLHNEDKQQSFCDAGYELFINNYSARQCALNTKNLYKSLLK